ncbi:hypothetical protein LSUE1_G006671 [Lachnellula suecica]|uniref:Uncharacterized protein n=1 Tax=Lachnellula suecica TaxID=602035 RepID=A0A8T9BY02_9HELO|nr:hypothetical protein LSUE1_G006671 [Lachnellula suecica]
MEDPTHPAAQATEQAPAARPASTTQPPPETSPDTLNLRAPIKHATPAALDAFLPPPTAWLQTTWTVTHSSLPMWKKAKNVRITYRQKQLNNGPIALLDTVENTPIKKGWLPSMQKIEGVDYPYDREGKEITVDGVDAAQWQWKGKGLLRLTGGSRWEVLGWGAEGPEKWVVTWFAASLFTPAGIDVYSSRREGINENLYAKIEKGLKELGVEEVTKLANAMFPVMID